jgi:hypothetical protein
VWEVKKVRSFENEKSAVEFIKQKTQSLSQFVTYYAVYRFLDGANLDKALNEFCFGEKFRHRNKYFLGKPPVEEIKKLLIENGVKIAK